MNRIGLSITDVAHNMKTKGRPLPQIAEDTGLSLEEINNL